MTGTVLLFEYPTNNPGQQLQVMPHPLLPIVDHAGGAPDLDPPQEPSPLYLLAFITTILFGSYMSNYGSIGAFVTGLFLLVVSLIIRVTQRDEARRQDPTVARTGYVPAHARQRQRVPTSEEDADQEIFRRRRQEKDETDEEIAQNVKGHLARMLKAGELVSAEGISFSEALQRASNNEQEVKEDSKSGGTSDALAKTDTVV
jgi:hypothetical protein